jgi:tetraacyldisaccharide 4'-kinase
MLRFKIVNYWYCKSWWNFPILILLPFAWLFGLCVLIRRWLYQVNILAIQRFPVPVIVVGNITVGGTGKTPFVIWLATFLHNQGFYPGIVSRGAGGGKQAKPHWVTQEDRPETVGDEAILLYKKTACPLVVGVDRAAAVSHLLQNSHCNIVISDDGLQHYSLGRDIEIVMVDSERRFGNQCLLPAGPLRESVSRLKNVDFVIENGLNNEEKKFTFTLEPVHLVSLQQKQPISLLEFPYTKVHAIAGIGNPERFFQILRTAGLDIITHIFPDHHLYQPHEIKFADKLPIIMTEKDAVKCEFFANERCWYLSVLAKMNKQFEFEFVSKLKLLRFDANK